MTGGEEALASCFLGSFSYGMNVKSDVNPIAFD